MEYGNILLSDVKLLDIIYQNEGGYFQDIDRVIDASDNVKSNINNFICRHIKHEFYMFEFNPIGKEC